MSWTDVKAAKGVADAANKAVGTAVEHWENCVSQVAKDLGDPGKTGSDADPWHELSEASSEIGESTYEAFKDQLKLRMTEAGAAAEDVENWVESHAQEVWKKAQELRKSKAVQAAAAKVAKVLHAVKVAFVSLVFGFLGIAFGIQKWENRQHGDAKTGLENTVAYYDAMQQFQASVAESEQMEKALDIDIPSTPDMPDPQAMAQVELPAAVALPPAVQAIAQMPVQITVTTPQMAVVETTRTVEQVYRASPTSRPFIQQRAECCSGGGGGGHTIGGWTVTGTPFGTFSFGF